MSETDMSFGGGADPPFYFYAAHTVYVRFYARFVRFAPATATFAPRVLKSFFGCEIIRSNAAESRGIFPKKEK